MPSPPYARPYAGVLLACTLLTSSPSSSYAGVSVGPVPERVKACFGMGDLYANVFGAHIVARGVSKNKVEHAANVLASYLDNDNDGRCDDTKVCDMLVRNTATLIMFPTSDDADEFVVSAEMLWYWVNIALNLNDDYMVQDLYSDETIPDSCAFTSAGASDDDDCNDQFDATLEEVLHLVTNMGVSMVYDSTWGEHGHSVLGRYMTELNGDCGNGYTGDWTDPSSGDCDGFYAYDDHTCDFGCLVTEGLYWALTSMLGAQAYRMDYIANEWTLGNATLMKRHASNLTSMLQDTDTWKWLPETLPDGSYSGQPEEKIPYFVNYSVLFVVLLLAWMLCCCGAMWRRCTRRGASPFATEGAVPAVGVVSMVVGDQAIEAESARRK